MRSEASCFRAAELESVSEQNAWFLLVLASSCCSAFVLRFPACGGPPVFCFWSPGLQLNFMPVFKLHIFFTYCLLLWFIFLFLDVLRFSDL